MAVALTKTIVDIFLDNGVRKVTIDATFAGNDVPDTLLNDTITVDISSVTNIAQFQAAIESAIHARGTSLGFTVGTNQAWTFGYVAG